MLLRSAICAAMLLLCHPRDAGGKVTAVAVHQDGNVLVNPRSSDAPAGRKAVKIAAGAFDAHVGRYELRPGLVMEISRDGERYFVQPNGQGRLEIFPLSETVFFSDDADAEISFEGQGMVFRQGGRAIPGRRL